MKTLELKQGLYWNGVLNPDLRVFDIIMMTEFGTTYNSYVLKGSKKTALFETAKLDFWNDYRSSLEELGVINNIDYIIVNHTEPDHAGSIAKVIEHNPGAIVVGTGTAISFLKEVGNTEFHSIAVQDGDTLSLGDKTLRFMILPNLHWPDTMYTYVEEDHVLFTCDSFGSHYSFDDILRSRVTDFEGYMRATKYYFENIIGPFADPYMVDALERIAPLTIDMICTGHGPVHDSHIDEIIQTYKEWCNYDAVIEKRKQKRNKDRIHKVVIPYVSAYGYTGVLAEKIADGIRSCGNIDVQTYDMVSANASAVQTELASADGILFGTPTIIGEALAPIWQLTLGLFGPVHGGKLASAFGSYAWSGEGVPHIIERLKQLNMEVIDGFTVQLKPNENDLKEAFNFGYLFGSRLKMDPPKKQVSGGKGKKKCLVCGEILDEDAEICPVCGVGTDKFISVPDTSTDYRKDTKETFLILGGGPAALNSAKAIRERNNTATIRILTNEAYAPYNRPMLTKALLTDFSDNQLPIEKAAWYEENNIEIIYNTEVLSIDTSAKTVSCNSGEYTYDKLIYALGARCFVVPIKGSYLDHVFTIRNIADTEKIFQRLPETKQVVCIGGGVMGLEGAWELQRGGFDVTLLEVAPGLLPNQLDAEGSRILEDIVKESGVKVITNAKIEEITKDEVILADGSRYPAQLVIMSTGMRPNTAIGEAAGIQVDRFLLVDDQMQTNIKDVYACGDCVSISGIPQVFWSQAIETGRIAGANAAGEELTYDQISSSMMINAFETSIFALGTNGKEKDREYRTVEIMDKTTHSYEKYYFYHNILKGVILIGDTSRMTVLTEAIENAKTFAELFQK